MRGEVAFDVSMRLRCEVAGKWELGLGRSQNRKENTIGRLEKTTNKGLVSIQRADCLWCYVLILAQRR